MNCGSCLFFGDPISLNPFVGSRTRHTLPIHSMSPPARCAPARIDDWVVVDGGSCPFEAPELCPIQIFGVVTNHPILEDGPTTTSLVQMIDQARGLARTLSTEYELGTPSVAFAAQLAKLGGAPLRYHNERVTLPAEQLAHNAARLRRLSAVHTNELSLEEAASALSLNSRLCTASIPPNMHRLCGTSSAPPMRRRCTTTCAPAPLRRLCTYVPPLRRLCMTHDDS